MINNIARQIEVMSERTLKSIPRIQRSEVGQFFTPTPIADFMASLFDNSHGNIKILDPGAGVGTLFAALVSSLCSHTTKPQSIEVIAYETDEKLFKSLDKTMSLCRELCNTTGIDFYGILHSDDFIHAATDQLRSDLLFEMQKKNFTHVILNPPYKKINLNTRAYKLLYSIGIETVNYYSAFVWLSINLLKDEGELVAITPRSFFNGPYYNKFRKSLLESTSIRQIHVFNSRNEAFSRDNVLQENVIFHCVKDKRHAPTVEISSSSGLNLKLRHTKNVLYDQVVIPDDCDSFIHLVDDDEKEKTLRQSNQLVTSLADLSLEVSTGRVVDFRVKEYLLTTPTSSSAPLIYPCHFGGAITQWPLLGSKKPNAITVCERTKRLLIPSSGYYVLTRRFSSKEERRRVVAAICDPLSFGIPVVGIENHLNYFHRKDAGIPYALANGLMAFLNSSYFDQYFRLFSGHTQVNATDLRKVHYPTLQQLKNIGEKIICSKKYEHDAYDKALEEECFHE